MEYDSVALDFCTKLLLMFKSTWLDIFLHNKCFETNEQLVSYIKFPVAEVFLPLPLDAATPLL